MKGVTKRQREILDFIKHYIDQHTYSPSYREIMQQFGFSSLGSVHKHIYVLKRKGLLAQEKQAGRSLALIESTTVQAKSDEIEIPYIGYIGSTIELFPRAQSVFVPHLLIPSPENSYAMRVRGQTFREELIGDGDLLLIESRREPIAGETFLALVDGCTVIRRYRLEENQSIVQGIVTGLLRFF